jgi:hypothetical protein
MSADQNSSEKEQPSQSKTQNQWYRTHGLLITSIPTLGYREQLRFRFFTHPEPSGDLSI